MEKVSFITVETGDDLILSFAVQRLDDASEIESLILQRTPKHEFIFDEHERGVKVSFERDEADRDEFLQRFDYNSNEAVVQLQTSSRELELDVRKVDVDELTAMCQVLKQMNFDQKFKTSGV
jgi:hypothetical protein